MLQPGQQSYSAYNPGSSAPPSVRCKHSNFPVSSCTCHYITPPFAQRSVLVCELSSLNHIDTAIIHALWLDDLLILIPDSNRRTQAHRIIRAPHSKLMAQRSSKANHPSRSTVNHNTHNRSTTTIRLMLVRLLQLPTANNHSNHMLLNLSTRRRRRLDTFVFRGMPATWFLQILTFDGDAGPTAIRSSPSGRSAVRW